MDILPFIKERRSCRNFLPDPVPEVDIRKIIEAALHAPSPLNGQPWSFVVITSRRIVTDIFNEASRFKVVLLEKSGWKWLGKYDLEFIKSVPVMIAVLGDPKRTGADKIMEGGGGAWRDSCGAAIQNMMLVAQSLGLASLWFTMFDKGTLKKMLGVADERVPLALVFLGKAGGEPVVMPKKSIDELTQYLR